MPTICSTPLPNKRRPHLLLRSAVPASHFNTHTPSAVASQNTAFEKLLASRIRASQEFIRVDSITSFIPRLSLHVRNDYKLLLYSNFRSDFKLFLHSRSEMNLKYSILPTSVMTVKYSSHGFLNDDFELLHFYACLQDDTELRFYWYVRNDANIHRRFHSTCLPVFTICNQYHLFFTALWRFMFAATANFNP